jgi:hypothetical protein
MEVWWEIGGGWIESTLNLLKHTVAGVGYAGEMHFLHRNTKFPNMTEALKHPEEPGVLAIAIFLNVHIKIKVPHYHEFIHYFFRKLMMTILLWSH